MANKKIRGGSLIARAIRDKGIEKVFNAMRNDYDQVQV